VNATCEQCGPSPARLVNIRRHVGLIVYSRATSRQAVLCRNHARSTVAGDLAKPVLLGWWGVLSLLINLVLIPEQVAELAKAGGIGQPVTASRRATMAPASASRGVI